VARQFRHAVEKDFLEARPLSHKRENWSGWRRSFSLEHEAFPVDEKTRATVMGIFALVFWGSTVAFSRSLTEKLGTFTSASYIFLLAGGLSCSYLIISRRLQRILHVSKVYLLGCGALFVVYMVSLYLAIGIATNRLQVLEVGLINYLWPSLTIVMTIPILKSKARFTLIPGCLLGFGGVLLASGQFGESWNAFFERLAGNWPPYALAFVAAVCWALYSNLARRWAREAEGGAVPLFLLASGLALAGLRVTFPERTDWTIQPVLELVYMAVFSSVLAYTFWDIAMRRGNVALVASLAYLTPLLSIVFGSLYLGVGIGRDLWAGCLLVIAGSITCKLSVKEDH
jgi:drug/metabolite transporter (DMT)-like permease